VRCPFCDSEDYDYVDVADYDQSDATLEFKCRGACGKKFFGMYSFLYFEDEEGNVINGEY
jgi:hypothetical protein